MSGGRDDGQKRRRPAQRWRARSGEDQGRAKPEGDRPNDGNGDDYEVGFGKPPRSTRFRKGQSGNPRGRPKKPKPKPIQLSDAPTDVFLQEEAYRPVKFRENGQEVELPTAQLLRRAQHNLGLKGNRIALKNALDDIEAKEKEHQQRLIDRYVRLSALKREGEAAIEAHRRRGLPPPDLLPHPDDIVLNHQTTEVWINGPEFPEEVAVFEHVAELRNLALMQSALWDKTSKARKNRPKGEGICAALLFATLTDAVLPRRFRWRDGEAVGLMMDYAGMTRRDLERRYAIEKDRLMRAKPEVSLVSPAMQTEIDRLSAEFFDRLRQKAEANGDGD
ncbi:MAG: hypothetical protein TEF_08660 [Rhizobiales bacterium NRL2]|jgi:hypothetical protein|nr:MAG: hypothetical protein TEF_08660 [Rhizobiales bacterium NRL2]